MEEVESVTYERLLAKAQEAFILAIEVYNRPSIRYRVEGFAFFICNAWELLLKAKLIKDKGMSSIYFKDNRGRTINLERCIALVFTNDKDPLRRNLEDIINLRNTSTHFVVEEHEQVYVGLFQSCVNNFDEKMLEFHERRIGDVVPPHFLTLSMSPSPTSPETIRAKYPAEIAEKFLFDEAEIEQEQLLQESQRYSTVLLTELSIVKNPEKADFTVAYDTSASRSIRIAKEFRDPKNTHPLSVGKLVDHVNKRLRRQGITLMASGEPKSFTRSDWALFMKFYGYKDDPQYGYCHEISKSIQYTYSMRTVEHIIDTIAANPEGVIDDLKALIKKKEAR